MRIEKITIKNFKSIKDTAICNTEDFCIFVGKNNTGKSNIFDVLLLLKNAAAKGDIKELYSSRNGFENISYGKDPKQRVEITIQVCLNEEKRRTILEELFKLNRSMSYEQALSSNFLRTLTYWIILEEKSWTERFFTDNALSGQLKLADITGILIITRRVP